MIFKNTKDNVEITKRFFEALEILKKKKTIRGLHTFTKKHNLNYWNIYTLRNEPQKHILKPELLALLVQDYNINAEWLLLGRGEIFKQR